MDKEVENLREKVHLLEEENSRFKLKLEELEAFNIQSNQYRFKLLNEQLTAMLYIDSLSDIYNYVCNVINQTFKGTIVLLNSVNKQADETCLESVIGLEGNKLSRIIDVLGFNPVGNKYPLIDYLHSLIKTGHLHEFKGGLASFASSELNPLVANAIEKLINLNKIYTIGILKDNNILACIHLFTFGKNEITDYDYVETIVAQAGLVIQKKQAELALKQSELYKEVLLNAIPDIMFVQDKDERYIDFHTPNVDLLYLKPQFFMGKKMEDVLPQNLVDDFRVIFKNAQQNCNLQFFEYKLPINDNFKDFEARVLAFDDDKILTIIRDITSQKEAQERIEQVQKNYETFFHSSDDFLFVLDMQAKIINVNNAVINRLEYSLEELNNMPVLVLHPEERKDEAMRILSKMLEGKEEQCLVPLVTKSGKQIAVETRVIKGIWDGVPALFGISKDISDLKLSEEKFSKAFQSNSNLMAFTDFETSRLIDINESFSKTLGYERHEIIGKTSKELGLFHEFSLREYLIEKIIKNEIVRDFEIAVRTKTGEIKYGLFSFEKVYLRNKLCLLSTMTDITERKNNETELLKLNTQLHELNLSKDRFISILAHDLKSPFNAILGLLKLLENNLRVYEIERIEKQIQIINSGAIKVYNLLEDILTWARAQSGAITFEPEKKQLCPMVDEIIESFKLTAQTKEIILTNQILLDIDVFADRKMLQTILRNLISNALKYTCQHGNILLTAFSKNNDVTIAVTDDGIGMDHEILQNLFDISKIYSTEGTDGEKGTGFGLLLAKEFVEKHNGTIWAESELGKGSSFIFTLPAAKKQTIE